MNMVSILFENPKCDLNIESIARTTNFFNVDFYISSIPKRKLSNGKSAGAIKNKYPKLLNIKDWKGRIIVTDSSFNTEPQDFNFLDNDLIVMGNENIGVSEEAKNLASGCIGIHQRGNGVRCLNVAVACGCILSIIYSKSLTYR